MCSHRPTVPAWESLPVGLLRRTAPSLLLIAAVTLATRLAALPLARADGMTPDGARLLNLARAIRSGEGFVTPEAFPAWIAPARLPMPERLKEPGYPLAVALLSRFTRDEFSAGQCVSLLAGLALPFVTWALVRALAADAAAATLAGLFAAASPILILQSVYVMAESLFALTLMLAFLLAERVRARRGGAGAAAAAGAMLGIAFLVRAQAAVAAPALLLWLWPSRERGSRPLAFAALAALLVVAPYAVRNLARFGAPFPVESRLVGLLAYMDPLALTTSPDPPPAFTAWALRHPVEVLGHAAASAWRMAAHSVPDFVLGSRLWLLPLAFGLLGMVRRARAWGPPMLYALLTLLLVLPINWPDRYLASVAPLFAAAAALGMTAAFERLESRGAIGRAATVALLGVLLAGFALQARRTREGVPDTFHPEIEAARAYGPWMRQRLEPGEAIMVETTSYWAWYSGRPAAHLVIAEESRVRSVLERLRVRWVALPASAVADLAARFPERRLPLVFEPVLEDRARDVAIYRVRLDTPGAPSGP